MPRRGQKEHIKTTEMRTTDVEIEGNIPFSKMMLSDNVLRGLTANGFTQPSPIQLRAIPLGRSSLDLLVQAKSGTGKTLVFATIILEAFLSDIKTPQSLILAPTREIAVQIEQTLTAIGSATPGFKVGCFIGGLDITDDRKNTQGCRAVVGTPGRILHLIKNNVINTDHIGIFVLDEADKLMNSSFLSDIKTIWRRLPPKRQVLAVSATFNGGLDLTCTQFMRNPIGVTPKREVPILLGVQQFAYILPADGITPMSNMQEMFAKVKAIQRIFSMVPFKQCLIFSNSQSRADSYCNYLTQNGWPSEVIAGCQDQLVRLKVFKKFKTFECRILVATDLMARGVDSENVNLVINLDVPTDSVTYLHRIGRCGRFGSQGMAVTLIASDNQRVAFEKVLGSLGGKSMSVSKFPHTIDNEDVWKYKSVDVRDMIFGAGEFVIKHRLASVPVQDFVCLNSRSVSATAPELCSGDDDDDDAMVDGLDSKPDRTIQLLNGNAAEKRDAIIGQNMALLKAASLLIDSQPKQHDRNGIENVFGLMDLDSNRKTIELPELTDPFQEYNALFGKEEVQETVAKRNPRDTLNGKGCETSNIPSHALDDTLDQNTNETAAATPGPPSDIRDDPKVDVILVEDPQHVLDSILRPSVQNDSNSNTIPNTIEPLETDHLQNHIISKPSASQTAVNHSTDSIIEDHNQQMAQYSNRQNDASLPAHDATIEQESNKPSAEKPILPDEDPFKAYSMVVGGCSTTSVHSFTTTADIHEQPCATDPMPAANSNSLFLDAIARLDLYIGTKNKEPQLAFDEGDTGVSICLSTSDAELNSNTAGSNAGSSEIQRTVDDIGERCLSHVKQRSASCSYAASVDAVDGLAQEGTASIDTIDGEADDEASVACAEPMSCQQSTAQQKWNEIYMKQLQQIQSFSDYYNQFNRLT